MTEANAIIIGCGIAGPAVALFLHRAGIKATIYEAQPAPDDYAGIFLTVASNGMNVLQTLGLYDEILKTGFPTKRLVLANGQGRQLGVVPIGAQAEGAPVSVTIKRGELHRHLREAATDAGIPIHFGKRLINIVNTGTDSTGRGVTVHFADGSEAQGTFVVGCDGLHSPVRTVIDPTAPQPTYTDLLSGGGYAHLPHLAATTDTMRMVFGKQAFFGYLVKPGGETYWFENCAYPGTPTRAELAQLGTEGWRHKLLALHEEDLPLINEIIRNTTSEIAMYPIYDLPQLPQWHNEHMVLIGDAAHATSPSAGQGAAMALEDAIVLANCLRTTDSPQAAFMAYEKLRRTRTERIVRYSRQQGNNKAIANPIGRWLRDLMTPLFLKLLVNSQKLNWLYDYQVPWEETAQDLS